MAQALGNVPWQALYRRLGVQTCKCADISSVQRSSQTANPTSLPLTPDVNPEKLRNHMAPIFKGLGGNHPEPQRPRHTHQET